MAATQQLRNTRLLADAALRCREISLPGTPVTCGRTGGAFIRLVRVPRVFAMLSRIVSFVAASVLAGGTSAAMAAGASMPTAATAQASADTLASPCQAAYSVTDQWTDGFTVSVTITNSDVAITAWTLQLTFPGDQQLYGGWDGDWSEYLTSTEKELAASPAPPCQISKPASTSMR